MGMADISKWFSICRSCPPRFAERCWSLAADGCWPISNYHVINVSAVGTRGRGLYTSVPQGSQCPINCTALRLNKLRAIDFARAQFGRRMEERYQCTESSAGPVTKDGPEVWQRG